MTVATREPPRDDTGETPPAARPRVTSLAARPLFPVIVGFLGLLVVFSAVNGDLFLATANFRNIALDAAIIVILAAGATYVIITAGIDLSIGSILVFAGVVAMKVMIWIGGDGWAVSLAGLAAALLAGAVWGLLNGALVAKARLNPIIVTLASLGAALGMSLVITDGQDLVDVPPTMIEFGGARVLGIPSIVLVAAVVAAILGIILAKTVFGRYTYAVGSNFEAAERAGIAVRRHLVYVYMLSGVTAGLAGWLSLARFSTTNISGHSLDSLNAITGVLLGGASLYGGVGTILGTVLGTSIPVVLANGLVIANVQSYWQQVVTGAVLVLAVYIDRVRREGSD